MTKSVPDGWLDYKPYGEVIKGTKILPFKVPLKEAVVNNLTPEQRFTPTILLQAFPRLKCIVDLTNTERYYDKKEFTNADVKHEKIMIPGKRVPPQNSVMNRSIITFRCILRRNIIPVRKDDNLCRGRTAPQVAPSSPDDVIGVHCTHGINRSGYLICRYLIQQLGWELQDSLKAFEEARGYPIYRDAYVAALKEIPRGEKIDTNKINLFNPSTTRKENYSIPVRRVLDQYRLRLKHPKGRPVPYPMGPPPGFKPHRRGFTNGAPYPPQPFGFGAPPLGFGSMPPHPPGMPLPPPPGPPMYGPRPLRYGPPPPPPPPPPAMRASGPGFHPPGFPLRLPGLPRMAGPPRLPPGPPSRLPPPKMPPPPPPPPPQVRQAVVVKRLQAHKKKHHNQHQEQQIARNGRIIPLGSSMRLTKREVSTARRIRNITSKITKEQDFTVDTFEENLLAVSSTNAHLRRPLKGRYHQTK
ncbi:RNA/RNP complex-1-interacting phosphatase-like isoform X3 [Vespa velutina]|uniref:RNA/RNP complex-1-interacting phosphatase-like isoform X3 n=1 Tax=Vespa velutina TaxID=202808 RepID=UPI001FB21A70|nr:RNA/RNP complex-1-interacting phosphatase-like isoform X3 [Vespa velutina]